MNCKERDKENEPLGFKFKIINDKFAQNFNNELKIHDITFSQMGILWYLEHNQDHKITQKELSEAMHIKHPTTIGLLKRLEEKSMIEIKVDAENRKYKNIAMTDKAKDFLNKHRQHRKELDNVLIKGMSEDEVRELRMLLDKVYDNMKDF
ncbi:MAG: MarR family transcriptional regulator [Butyrivibrio sp.]|nr:MarR family transcriptional regulator [Butyrivibrio sp.]